MNQTDEDARRHLMLAMRYTLDVLDSLSNALREITRETLEEPVVHRRPSPTPYRSDNATKGRSFLGRHRPREASTLDLFRRQP